MHETSLEIDGTKYWISAITGEVVSKEIIPERNPSMSEPREAVFIVDSSEKEHSIEMEVLTSEFRKGSTISLIYLSRRESRPGKLGLVYNYDTKKNDRRLWPIEINKASLLAAIDASHGFLVVCCVCIYRID